jgi:hypothetical protein
MAAEPSVIIATQTGMLTAEAFIMSFYLQRRVAAEAGARSLHFQIKDLIAMDRISDASRACEHLADYVADEGFPRSERHLVSAIRFLATAVVIVALGGVYSIVLLSAMQSSGPRVVWIDGFDPSVVGTASILMASVTLLLAILSGTILRGVGRRIEKHSKDADRELKDHWKQLKSGHASRPATRGGFAHRWVTAVVWRFLCARKGKNVSVEHEPFLVDEPNTHLMTPFHHRRRLEKRDSR